MPGDGSSAILHERARRHHWEGEGLLSVKAFFAGRALYNVGGGCYAVDEESYLVLNHRQPYAITVESATPVESFCVFFAPGLAADVERGLTAPVARLLDEPEGPAGHPPAFFERTYRHDDLVSPALFALRAALAGGCHDHDWLVERLHDLLARLLGARANVYREVAALPAARAATREELYRRVYRARDYAAALLDRSVTLDDLARVACLSPNHLLRSFKLVFGQTPHQYLTALRLERARRLLAEADRPVTDICLAVGFQSPGSFSWLFRRRVGLSPEAYRRQFR